MERESLFRHAHVIDPSQSISRVLDVRIRGCVIAEVGESLRASEESTVTDLHGFYLCPGLVDLHGHWYKGSAFGIDPERCLPHGACAVVDAGTTGFVNFPDFRHNCIEKVEVRVLAFVNISAWGIPTSLAGELEDLRYARPKETISVLQENADVTVGVKVRMRQGHRAEALGCALEAAQATNLPVMVHISPGARTAQILRQLRPGDILTHCFQGRGDGILERGALIPEAILAKEVGVIFDVGHGCGSFSWGTAKKAFEHFFYPDTISTDLHRYSVERWAFDMPTTMSKFLHLGMSIEDVILKSTWAPAKAIRRERELGTLRVGTPADLFVFSIESGKFPLEDTHLKVEMANRRIKPHLVIKDGQAIASKQETAFLRRLYECDYDLLNYIERTA